MVESNIMPKSSSTAMHTKLENLTKLEKLTMAGKHIMAENRTTAGYLIIREIHTLPMDQLEVKKVHILLTKHMQQSHMQQSQNILTQMRLTKKRCPQIKRPVSRQKSR